MRFGIRIRDGMQDLTSGLKQMLGLQDLGKILVGMAGLKNPIGDPLRRHILTMVTLQREGKVLRLNFDKRFYE